jgi:hypothetical protein
MARSKKKKPARRGDSTSPNTVLVIFLVFFVLATLGVGGWAWSLNNERHKWSKEAKDEKDKTTGLQKAIDWYKFQSYDARAALGDPAFKDDKSDEYNTLKLFHEALDDQNSKFKEEKDFEPVRQLIAKNRKELEWKGDVAQYKSNYRTRLAEAGDALKNLQGQLDAEKPKTRLAEEKFRSLFKEYDKIRTELTKLTTEGNASTLAAATKRSEEMDEQIKRNQNLEAFLKKMDKDSKDQLRLRDLKIKDLAQKAQGTGDPINKGPKRDLSEPHSLVLDVSKGKALWDLPRGKIVRVDQKERKVYLDKGADHGVKPGLTFNIFEAGRDGRAEGPLKATVEVTRVLNGDASIGRITSLYDTVGAEISLNETASIRVNREAGNPLKEGDLLYNLVWGARVAVAGVIDLSGQTPDSPAAQMASLDQFVSILERQGVIVDAILDLRDGRIHGAITNKTNFLIRGLTPIDAKGAKTDRIQLIQESVKEMRKDAVERGLFVLSPENFSIVIGYRRPRSASDTRVGDFRPFLPVAGGSYFGLKPGDNLPNGKTPEKKGPEKKEPEKKDKE